MPMTAKAIKHRFNDEEGWEEYFNPARKGGTISGSKTCTVRGIKKSISFPVGLAILKLK